MQSAKVLARELVRTRKAITQMYTQKAHIISMSTQLSEQLAIVKVERPPFPPSLLSLHALFASRAFPFSIKQMRSWKALRWAASACFALCNLRLLSNQHRISGGMGLW